MIAPAILRACPKVELHIHLDGALRMSTLHELARAARLPAAAGSLAEFARRIVVPESCRSLAEFLKAFELICPALRQPGALRRAARELVEDKAREGVIHVEMRFAASLMTTTGWTMEHAVVDALSGMREGMEATGICAGLILCCDRGGDPAASIETARIAARYSRDGVVGIDLAGPESAPARPHAAAFWIARDVGLHRTAHAGEAGPPENIAEAISLLRAERIGHGLTLVQDEALLAAVADAGIALEVCPTSNVHTGGIATVADHPFNALRAAGVPVTLSTDDPLISQIDLVHEYAIATRVFGMTLDDLRIMNMTAANHAFVPAHVRETLLARIVSWQAPITPAGTPA